MSSCGYQDNKTKEFLIRFDGLDKRVVKDMELAEFYRADLEGLGGLKKMKVTFFIGEKKFGPAEEQTKGNREIEKIVGSTSECTWAAVTSV